MFPWWRQARHEVWITNYETIPIVGRNETGDEGRVTGIPSWKGWSGQVSEGCPWEGARHEKNCAGASTLAMVCAEGLWYLRNRRRPHAAQWGGRMGRGGEGMMSERKKGPYSPGWGLWILSEPGSHWRALSWGVTSSNEHWRRIIYQGQRWSRGSGPGETNALGLVVAVGMVGSR